MARLQLVWRDRPAERTQTPRRFLDFVVDGGSLLDRITHDVISCLGWLPPHEDDLAAARLLGEAPPDLDGRVSVLVCPECADLDCGAVAATVSRKGDAFVWRDLAYCWPDHIDSSLRQEPIPGLDSLRFDASAYRAAITGRPRRD